MHHVFYTISLFFIFSELLWIISPFERTKGRQSFELLSKSFKGKKWNVYSEEYKAAIIGKIPNLFILFWLFVGLFTSQWALFLAFIAFTSFIVTPISLITKYNLLYTGINWIASLIGFAFGIFLILNHYHLHINVLEFVRQLIEQ